MPSLAERPRISDQLKKLGRCIELVSIDPHFHDVTIGLFLKGGVMTVWSFSDRAGIAERIEQIRDRCTRLGDVVAVDGTTDQLKLISDLELDRALKFMFTAAVEKTPPENCPPGGSPPPTPRPSSFLSSRALRKTASMSTRSRPKGSPSGRRCGCGRPSVASFGIQIASALPRINSRSRMEGGMTSLPA